jgi:hypothetical protein
MHALMQHVAHAGTLMPLRLARRDPAQTALRRAKAAIVREAQALTRPRRG